MWSKCWITKNNSALRRLVFTNLIIKTKTRTSVAKQEGRRFQSRRCFIPNTPFYRDCSLFYFKKSSRFAFIMIFSKMQPYKSDNINMRKSCLKVQLLNAKLFNLSVKSLFAELVKLNFSGKIISYNLQDFVTHRNFKGITISKFLHFLGLMVQLKWRKKSNHILNNFNRSLGAKNHLRRSLENVWQQFLHNPQALVQIFQNSDNRVKLFDVLLCSLKNLFRIEHGAVVVVAAECHHLTSVVFVICNLRVWNKLTIRMACNHKNAVEWPFWQFLRKQKKTGRMINMNLKQKSIFFSSWYFVNFLVHEYLYLSQTLENVVYISYWYICLVRLNYTIIINIERSSREKRKSKCSTKLSRQFITRKQNLRFKFVKKQSW